jgi:hypothetical protein
VRGAPGRARGGCLLSGERVRSSPVYATFASLVCSFAAPRGSGKIHTSIHNHPLTRQAGHPSPTHPPSAPSPSAPRPTPAPPRPALQLGYTVHSGSRLTHGVLGFCVVVVSAAYGVDHVEGRVEAFLAEFRGTLQVGCGLRACARVLRVYGHALRVCACGCVRGVRVCVCMSARTCAYAIVMLLVLRHRTTCGLSAAWPAHRTPTCDSRCPSF